MRKSFLILSLLFIICFTASSQCCTEQGNGYKFYGGTINSVFDGVRMTIHTNPSNYDSGKPELEVIHANHSTYSGLKIQNRMGSAGWRIYHESGDQDFSLRYGPSGNSSWRAVIRASSGEYVSKSDLRFKQDINEISYGLKEVLQMRPVSYQFKESKSGYYHLGFIAQEMEGLVAESVITRKDEMSSKGIAYSSLVPVLVKAIQDQNKLIHDMSNSLDQLRAEVEVMKRQGDGAANPK